MVAPVTAVADVLALRGKRGWLTPPLRPVVSSPAPVCGTAVTIELDCVESGVESGADFKPMYALLSSDLSGKVVVVAGAHRVDGAVWGEILGGAALQSKATAVIVDGRVRDVEAIAAIGIPTYAAETAVVGPNGTATVRAVAGPVEVAGVTVREGDCIVVDGDGCVVVGCDDCEQILTDSDRYAAAEEAVVRAIAGGEALSSAYRHKADVVANLKGSSRQSETTGEDRRHGGTG